MSPFSSSECEQEVQAPCRRNQRSERWLSRPRRGSTWASSTTAPCVNWSPQVYTRSQFQGWEDFSQAERDMPVPITSWDSP